MKKTQYITCVELPDGRLAPMGESKDLEYARELAKRHGQVVYRLVKVDEE